MSGRIPRAWLPLLLLAAGGLPAPAQQIKEMQFVNQPVNDILLALGEISGKSIIPDETVGGTASYHFAATDFDTALQVFLSTYKMYVRKADSVYYVSRIRVEADAAAGTISMDAEDVEIPYLIRAASKALGRTILFDPLPGQPLTVHVSRMSADKLLEIIVKRFPDYKVEADQDFFYVKRIPTTPPPATAGRPGAQGSPVERVGEQYSLKVDKGRFVDVVDALFGKAQREYSLMTKKDVILDKLRFEAKPFERILRLLLEQANADYALIGEIYYIFEIEQRDVLKKLNTTVRIPLTYVSAKELPNLFPAELLSAQLFRIDAARNAVILSGSVEEIGPAQEFLRQVDRPIADRSYQVFRLSFLNATKIAALLPPEYRHLEPIIIPESNSFVALMSEDSGRAFAEYLALIDKPAGSATVKLKYLKAEDLLKKLPPSLAKEEILETGDPSVVFVRASADKLADFYRELKVLDKPVPQIRYQILVIQYSKGDSLNWKSSPSATTAASGATNGILASLGKLNLSFDIISSLGLQFALNLEAQLSANDAKVRADTALVGLSGQDLEFRNTETFRYQEVEVDEKGNTIFTGVTREITSGLIFKIQGWVSGDQMITMNVKATVSKRGAATATDGSPGIPPTSENIVNTLARTASGQPVVIGGLMRQDSVVQVDKVPLLGHIPLLGLLFQRRTETLENSEIVIYIVPRVEFGQAEEADPALTLERLYQRFFKS
jgi:type II secretory pathway component GspD/PulD (secretin)